MRHGFIKVAAATPDIRVADVDYNKGQIIKQMDEAADAGAKIIVFPELCITGYTLSLIHISITTIAGFIALCFMSFTLGLDIGIVMVKGVIFGVIACVTILPSMILCCDKIIEKTKHKPFLPDIGRISDKVTKRYLVYVVLFLLFLFPAIYGNNHTAVYYNLDETLPKDLPSIIANEKLKEDYDMNTTHMILVDSSVSSTDVNKMIKEMDKVDGVKWALGLDSLVGPSVCLLYTS